MGACVSRSRLGRQTRTATQVEIAEQLDRFESAAAALQKQTDHYAVLALNNTLHPQSHAYELNVARDQVNSLGRELSKLEELSPQGTELQQAAIREARPELQAVADHVQSAIVMFNEDRRSRGTPAFQQMRQTSRKLAQSNGQVHDRSALRSRNDRRTQGIAAHSASHHLHQRNRKKFCPYVLTSGLIGRSELFIRTDKSITKKRLMAVWPFCESIRCQIEGGQLWRKLQTLSPSTFTKR
jgi:hypothetical protein